MLRTRPDFLVALGLLLAIAQPFPAAALDCAKASQPIEKMLCSTAELRKADDDMSAAYFNLLRETRDPDFRAALIRSQQRWLKNRLLGPAGWRMGDNDDPLDDREVLLTWTRERLEFLASGRPIRAMEDQRKTNAKDSGEPFEGYTAHCNFLPPRWASGAWIYECWGAMYRQRRDRICSVSQMWASGHMTDFRLVSVVRNGKPTAVAGCSIGYATTDEPCPEPFQLDSLKPVAHWTTDPDVQAEVERVPDPKELWKYDPDLGQWLYNQPWMDECLSAPVFPPPESSRPDKRR
jgi:uncharacterized protein YecT (DUF1311 family)